MELGVRESLEEEIKRLKEELKVLRVRKKYGLVWEEHEEELDKKGVIPLLRSREDLTIKGSTGEKKNYLIEGDNYHALKALQHTHLGKIDVVYIDPPYNTGNKDFVYNDSFVDKEDGFRHSKWLSFMSKRLELARELLSDDGVIFVSIDDNEQAQLKLLMDSIFGEKNFVSNFIWEINTAPSNLSKNVRRNTEYVVTYVKNKQEFKGFVQEEKVKKDNFSLYNGNNTENTWRIPKEYIRTKLKDGIYSETEQDSNVILENTVEVRDGKFLQDVVLRSKFTMVENTMLNRLENGEMYVTINTKTFTPRGVGIDKVTTVRPVTLLGAKQVGTTLKSNLEMKEIFGGERVFNYTKPKDLLKKLIHIYNDKNATVLDFFAGSGTTGHAVMELNKEDGGNRTFILCTNNEVSEDNERKYLFENKLIPKNNKTEFNKYRKENEQEYREFLQSKEYENLGIARAVTRERIKRVIEGYTTPKGKGVEGLGGNLQYLQTSEVCKSSLQGFGRKRLVLDVMNSHYMKYPEEEYNTVLVDLDFEVEDYKRDSKDKRELVFFINVRDVGTLNEYVKLLFKEYGKDIYIEVPENYYSS